MPLQELSQHLPAALVTGVLKQSRSDIFKVLSQKISQYIFENICFISWFDNNKLFGGKSNLSLSVLIFYKTVVNHNNYFHFENCRKKLTESCISLLNAL